MIGVATMRKFTGYEKNVTNSLHVFIFKCRMYSLNTEAHCILTTPQGER